MRIAFHTCYVPFFVSNCIAAVVRIAQGVTGSFTSAAGSCREESSPKDKKDWR
jgi:hypothetical protein